MVRAAVVSCTTRATGRPYSTSSPAETSCCPAVNAPVTVMPSTAHATASGIAMTRTVATVEFRLATGAGSGAVSPGCVAADVTVMTVQW